MVSRRDYEDLASVPGAVPKPSGKRAKAEGRTSFNSTLKSYTRLSPVSKKREANEAEIFGPQAEACRMLSCCACGKPPPSDPHHEPTVARGGLDHDTTPLCRTCHDDAQPNGRKFWRRVGLDPRDVQQAVRDWMAAGYPQGSMPFAGRKP